MTKHFYTNGVIDRKFADGDVIPAGFYRGRTNGCNGFGHGRIAINDGVNTKYIKKDADIPVGYSVGALPKSDEHKRKISKALAGRTFSTEHCRHISESHQTDAYKNKITNTLLERYGVDNAFKADFVKVQCNTPEVVKKRFNTMKENNTIRSSKLEDKYYKKLLKLFGDDVIRQYKDYRYPYACDFYIKSLDLFIEIQGLWTHGPHPFNKDNPEDLMLKEQWELKAKESAFYVNALETWCERDVTKLNSIIENNLNYIFIYNDEIITNQEIALCKKIK